MSEFLLGETQAQLQLNMFDEVALKLKQIKK